MFDWLSGLMENGTAPWYLAVSLIASCIGIFSSIAILYRSYKYISVRILQRRKRKYLTEITTGDYIDWERRTLKEIYQSDETVKNRLGLFVNQGDRDYPVIVRTGSDDVVFSKEHDQFQKFKTELTSSEHELLVTRLPHYRRFRSIVADQVHFPELYGYTNKGFLTDKGLISACDGINDKICGFTAQPRTYKETVFSCHVLQYELWRAFQKKKLLSFLLRRKTIPVARLKELSLRNLIHNGKLITKTEKGVQYYKLVRDKHANGEKGQRISQVVYDGVNRSSLCDVNLVILKKTDPNQPDFTQAWSVAVGRRSENVATFPGYWSIVPSGSFEMSEKTITPKDRRNALFLDKLDKNKNIVFPLYREYLEEVFNLSDYEHPNGDCDLYQLKNNQHIMDLKDSINGSFFFLGVCFNLIILRQTISFALVVRDNSLLNDVRHNNENTIIDFVSLKELEQIVRDEEAVMPELAGTYRLLVTNKKVMELINPKVIEEK